jgi:hypothetical protein
MKWMMVATVSDLGVSKLCKKDKLTICKAVAHLESYYAGYTEAIATAATVLNWYYDVQRAKLNKVGLSRSNIYKPTYDRPNYIDEIETLFPGYLQQLYRAATKDIGHDASIKSLHHHMNINSRSLHMDCPHCNSLKLNVFHFRKWFLRNGRKFRKCTTKPTLTGQQRKARLVWAQEMKQKLTNTNFHYCFLDKKWFYVR